MFKLYIYVGTMVKIPAGYTSVLIINKDFINNKNYHLNYVSIVVNNCKEELKSSIILFNIRNKKKILSVKKS